MLVKYSEINDDYCQGEKNSVLDVADDIYRTISYKEAAVLVSSQIYEKSGIKIGYLPSRNKKPGENVILHSSHRAIELYNKICCINNIEKLDSPVSTQVIRKLHLLAFGEEFVKKARQKDGDYLSFVVKLNSPIRAYKALYKVTTQDVPIEFEGIDTDINIDETHEKEKLTNQSKEIFSYPRYSIFLNNIKIGTVFKVVYYVRDKNNRVRKKSALSAEVNINIDGEIVSLKSPNKKVIANTREWLVTKLRNCLKNMIQPTIEYKSNNRGIVFAAMPMMAKLAQMNSLLAQAPAGRDSDLVDWIERQEVDPDGIPYFPNRELLSSLIIN